MKGTVLVLTNDAAWTYGLRAETFEALLKEDYRVVVVVGDGYGVQALKDMGCEHINVAFNGRGKNPLNELKLFSSYRRIIKRIRPDVVLSYTIKPNLYGSIICRKFGIPCIANITGLGTAVEYPGLSRNVLLAIYRVAFKGIYKVFFQNTFNRDVFLDNGIVKDNYELIPGSGVNLERFSPISYPDEANLNFVYIARVMKEKGIEQYLDAAKFIRKKYPQTMFHICGGCDDKYKAILEEYQSENLITYHGRVADVREVLKYVHCVVLPTYYPEGMCNVLLESAATARPLITTTRPGCGEIIDDGINGYAVEQRDSQSVIDAIEKFIALDNETRKTMGLRGREKVESQFDRKIVVEAYLRAVENL